MKPMLACDYDESKLKFPLIAQPKIDGVRALNMIGTLTGRSLKTFKNKHVTALLSHPALIGLDGEIAAESQTHPDLCRLTTSALGRIDGQPFVIWWLFDFMDPPGFAPRPYHHRYAILQGKIQQIGLEFPSLAPHLRIVPSFTVANLDALNSFDEHWLNQGYEGTILRDPKGLHKQGRSTVREGGLLRMKRFVDAEAVVKAVTEGESNQNEATINKLGHTERSSHQANMVPNGMVGNLICLACKDVVVNGVTVIKENQEITVAAGRLTAEDRAHYFRNQNQIIGKMIKFQFFPKGIKDKPRFPTFQSFRDEADQ